ncbi:sensor histidine kinase [Rugosimonospora acidiphila]|uniref:histidine kinase n=2 Tax=Rugosimonospora acidiphila TaxID=556531 RepID=A0ABP9RZU6_9ACTN
MPLRWARMVAGLLLGCLSVPVEVGYLVAAGLCVAALSGWPAARRTAVRGSRSGLRGLTGFEGWRMATFFGEPTPREYPDRRALGFLSLRLMTGLLGGAVLALLGYGARTVALAVWVWLHGGRPDGIAPRGWIVAYLVVACAVLAFLVLQGIHAVANLERRLGRWLAAPNEREAFRRRISELAATRADVVAAIDDERRRIERDLHDGVQQRLVALGMLLGRARRAQQPERIDALIRQAHDESQRALEELREVAWRVYPTTLDNGGLPAALETVAERSALPVRIDLDLPGALDRATATVIYFIVCESVTNAVKHSAARQVTVQATRAAGVIEVRVSDDGVGGADPAGGGLTGLARRVAALDGRLRVDSPAGGPTSVIAELPCG